MPKRTYFAPALARDVFVLSIAAASHPALACACGCRVFDISANSAFPNQADSGLSV
jgi:hypothetical protein